MHTEIRIGLFSLIRVKKTQKSVPEWAVGIGGGMSLSDSIRSVWRRNQHERDVHE